ncbi:MAG: 2-oxoacid:ferredoxin oxidoreductase subunit beta [Candidatus Cloacimonetes bacterium]|nr:2-oxoacid:ferredoxin oxidoreductase subunit beta [Candidatus Cloacimonadota bacterium]
MKKIPQKVIHRYLRHDKKFPHVWCPGCGIGTILGDFLRAVYNIGIPKDEIVMVSGIGCSGRMPVYVDFNTLHTTHGRAIAFATGIKFSEPRLKVVVISGDGDAAAIGGNHLIHAARRNIDLTIIIINNSIYGMTGGQASPTTPLGDYATTAPFGSIEPEFDLCKLAESAGASFVARTTAYHTMEARQIFEAALNKKGCAVVETIAQCPVSYGKMNQQSSAIEMLKWQKENTVSIKSFDKLSPEKRQDKIVRGIIVDKDREEFTARYENLIKRLQKNESSKEKSKQQAGENQKKSKSKSKKEEKK